MFLSFSVSFSQSQFLWFILSLGYDYSWQQNDLHNKSHPMSMNIWPNILNSVKNTIVVFSH